jgi:hypothetical protein
MLIATTGDYQPDPAQLEHYWASLELLEHRRRDDPLVRQLRFELEALSTLAPEPGVDR